MARENKTISANELITAIRDDPHIDGRTFARVKKHIKEAKDAVEVADMIAFAKDVVYQFGYYCQCEGRLHITHGGLSTLEDAFEILGWDNLHPVPECECEIEGCHEHATCGVPTADGYKRMCGKHCLERREGE